MIRILVLQTASSNEPSGWASVVVLAGGHEVSTMSKFDGNRRAAGVLNPMRDKTPRRVPGEIWEDPL